MPVYERASNVNVERDGTRIFLQTPDSTEQWIVLEGTAMALWDALQAASDPATLAARLGEGFAGEPAVIRGDVEEVLTEWRRRGLVVSR